MQASIGSDGSYRRSRVQSSILGRAIRRAETSFKSLRDVGEGLSLRVHVGLMTGCLCVGLVALVSLGGALVGRHYAVRDAKAHMTQLSSELAHRLDTSLAQRYLEIDRLAQLQPLQPAWTGDPAVLRSVLDQLQASFPAYAWIGFATPDGIVRSSTGGLLEGQSVGQRPWFDAGRRGPTVSDLHEAILLDKLLGRQADDQAAHEPRRFVDVAFPVRDASGRLLGVLGAHLYVQWIDGLRKNFADLLDATEPNGHDGTVVRILSANGRVIAGPGAGSVLLDEALLQQVKRRGMLAVTVDARGHSELEGLALTRGSSDFPGFGWIVSVCQPTSYSFAPVRAMTLAIVTIGAAAAVIGMLLIYLLAGHIASPIRRLCQEADRIGRTRDTDTFKRVGGSLEVLQLSHALRSLVRRLGTAERQLLDTAERASTTSASMQRQMEQLRRLAASDPMTGLLNRRGFLEAARRTPDLAPGSPVGVLIIDIDHFKKVNDTLGHAAGDAVIRTVAAAIKATARHSDLVARFGGEEFVVLAREANAVALMSLAERVRNAVGQASASSSPAIPVTVSLGVAMQDGADEDLQDTIDRADMALYAAKQAGRNRAQWHGGAGTALRSAMSPAQPTGSRIALENTVQV